MPQNYDTCSPNNTPPTQYVNSTNLGTPVLNYDISFPYIAATDVVVFTGETGNWTLRNQGTGANEYAVTPQTGTGTDEVVFVGGTPGANILITRRTDICAAARVFQAGSSIRAEDLNTDMNQLRFLYQELYSFLEMFVGNEGDELVPGENPSLDDLADVEITTPANPSWLRWNGTQWEDRPILEAGDAWSDDDNHVVTAAAGDDRWLGIPGGGGTTITAGDGIELTGSQIAVDLAATNPGLQFTGGDLQAIGNSVTENGGDVRLTNGPSNVTITGAGGINVTRTSATELTITDTADNNTTYDFGNTAVSGNARLRLTGSDGTTDDVLITAGNNVTFANNTATGFTINATGGGSGGSATVVANVAALNTAADGPPTDGDLFLLLDSTNLNAAAASGDNDEDVNGLPMTEAAGAPVGGYDGEIQVTMSWDNGNTRWQFIRWAVQEPDNRYVLEQGDTMTGNLLFNDGTANTAINVDGSAVFNENGDDVDFRVEGDGNANLLFLDASVDSVGIGTGTPGRTLDVNGSSFLRGELQLVGGNNVAFANTANSQTVSINADDATATYNLTLPPTGPTAANRVLAAAGTGIGADQELEWVAAGAPALWEANGNFLRPVANDDGVQIRNGANVTITLDREGGAVFNENSGNAANCDFRIESDDNQRMFFINASQNSILIGNANNTNNPETVLDIIGGVRNRQNTIGANWNLDLGNMWTVGGTTAVPNPTNMEEGMSGVIVVTTTTVTWPAAGGATIQYPNNTPPNITAVPAVIPFYCDSDTTILLGTPTQGIT